MADMEVNREAETEFGHTLCVHSHAESHRGESLVTLGADELVLIVLRPAEARDLARVLSHAADLAEGA